MITYYYILELSQIKNALYGLLILIM